MMDLSSDDHHGTSLPICRHSTTLVSENMTICHDFIVDEPFANAHARDDISPRQPLPDHTHVEQALQSLYPPFG
ncbi:uncharacterized protein TrAtP1_012630 [Trichoderma atroviride]|uniref:uncharacterized protein n=1 Tax=Hypocrea atroviridis TaxID=63577 RepID=UPI0033276215|nr:hypothetical protein TrAtP1_012630 [Trichoderma atroviride]